MEENKEETELLETKIKDLTEEEHTQLEVLQEAQKLCSFVLGVGKIKAEEVIEKQQLNHNNPVHLMGLVGAFINDIILKEIVRLSGDIEKLNKQAIELGEENVKLKHENNRNYKKRND